jgi:hypothetical protein
MLWHDKKTRGRWLEDSEMHGFANGLTRIGRLVRGLSRKYTHYGAYTEDRKLCGGEGASFGETRRGVFIFETKTAGRQVLL